MLGYSMHVRLEQRVSLEGELGVEDCVQGVYGKLIDDSIESDDPTDPKRIAGSLSCYIIKLGLATDLGVDALEACDAESQDLLEYGEAVLDPKSGHIKESVAEQFEAAWGDILVIHCATILPAYRGRKLGLFGAKRMIELFGHGLVVCRPQPLQHVPAFAHRTDETGMRYDLFAKSKTEAKKTLRAYWSQLGFERIGRSDFFGLSLARRLPDIGDGATQMSTPQ
jgi:hypothetical protein